MPSLSRIIFWHLHCFIIMLTAIIEKLTLSFLVRCLAIFLRGHFSFHLYYLFCFIFWPPGIFLWSVFFFKEVIVMQYVLSPSTLRFPNRRMADWLHMQFFVPSFKSSKGLSILKHFILEFAKKFGLMQFFSYPQPPPPHSTFFGRNLGYSLPPPPRTKYL